MYQHLDRFTNRMAWSLSRYVRFRNHSYTNALLETEAPCTHVTYWDHYDMENRSHIMHRLGLFMSCIDQHQENTGEILPEDALVPELSEAITILSQTSPTKPFETVDPAKALGITSLRSRLKLDTDVLQTYTIATEMALSDSVKLRHVVNHLRPFWGEKIPTLHEVLRDTITAQALP